MRHYVWNENSQKSLEIRQKWGQYSQLWGMMSSLVWDIMSFQVWGIMEWEFSKVIPKFSRWGMMSPLVRGIIQSQVWGIMKWKFSKVRRSVDDCFISSLLLSLPCMCVRVFACWSLCVLSVYMCTCVCVCAEGVLYDDSGSVLRISKSEAKIFKSEAFLSNRWRFTRIKRRFSRVKCSQEWRAFTSETSERHYTLFDLKKFLRRMHIPPLFSCMYTRMDPWNIYQSVLFFHSISSATGFFWSMTEKNFSRTPIFFHSENKNNSWLRKQRQTHPLPFPQPPT